MCCSISVDKTIKALDEKEQNCFERMSYSSISGKEWEEYIKDFCELIKTKFTQEHIIINRFLHADFYLEDETLKVEEKSKLYKERTLHTQNCEVLLMKYLPKAKVISPLENPIENIFHRIGRSPVHFTDECYYIQNVKLNTLLNISPASKEEIFLLENNFKLKFNNFLFNQNLERKESL